MLSLKNIAAAYGDDIVLQNINLQVPPGQIAVLVGSSGAGKSTVLKIAAGLLQPKTGEVFWKDEKIKGPKDVLVPGSEHVKWVAQDFDLMPYTTALENVGNGASYLLDDEKELRANELLARFGLEKWANKKANTLSGGQKQRVALAKALMSDAPCLLFDEVFSQLDSATAMQTMVQLKSLLKAQNKAALFVLHNPLACFFLADKVWVLQDGKLTQNGSPKQIYREPKNLEIAHLFGYVNVVPSDFAKRVFTKNVNVLGKQMWFRPEQISENEIATNFTILDTLFVAGKTLKIIDIEGKIVWLQS